MKKYMLLLLLFTLPFRGIQVQASMRYTIGIYYIYSNPNFDASWRDTVDEGMSYALPRLNEFFSYQSVQWTYTTLRAVEIDYSINPDVFGNLPSGLYNTIPLIHEAAPTFQGDYQAYDLFILLYAGDLEGAYSYDYQGPIYSSEGAFKKESLTKTLIEHEILHTFGLQDHNLPHTEDYYEECIMGNLNLGEIKLCPESQIEYERGTLKKEPFESLVPSSSIPGDTTESPTPPIIQPPEAPGPQSPVEGVAPSQRPLRFLVIVPVIIFILFLLNSKLHFLKR